MLVDVDPLAGAGEGHHLQLLLRGARLLEAEAGAGLRLGPGVAWLHAAGRSGHLKHVLTDLHGSSNYKLITQQGSNNNATNVLTVYTD